MAVGVCLCVVFVGVPCGGVSHVQVRIVTFSYDLSGDPPRIVFQEWTVGHSKMRLWPWLLDLAVRVCFWFVCHFRAAVRVGECVFFVGVPCGMMSTMHDGLCRYCVFY